ncbi:hypothetical protein IWZ03DRAFT_79188 [Phyllosticta citriasiana]|uniref:Uncharacterized protein n=1 Tax=Phyllosticta citriasiana TaxID=595635 RepID=A0ABR1K9L7_9PEZI
MDENDNGRDKRNLLFKFFHSCCLCSHNASLSLTKHLASCICLPVTTCRPNTPTYIHFLHPNLPAPFHPSFISTSPSILLPPSPSLRPVPSPHLPSSFSLSLSLSSLFPTSFLLPCHLSTHTVICLPLHPSIRPSILAPLQLCLPVSLLFSIPNRQPARLSVRLGPQPTGAACRRLTSMAYTAHTARTVRTARTYIPSQIPSIYLSIYHSPDSVTVRAAPPQ